MSRQSTTIVLSNICSIVYRCLELPLSVTVQALSLRSEPAAHTSRAEIEIPGGFPSPAQDYATADINLNEHLLPNPNSSYLMRVRGDSMTGAGIWDGDEIVVDRSIRPRSGDVVVAVVDGEMTVKTLVFQGDQVVLKAENPDHPDLPLPELADLRVWGVVTFVLHHVIHRSY